MYYLKIFSETDVIDGYFKELLNVYCFCLLFATTNFLRMDNLKNCSSVLLLLFAMVDVKKLRHYVSTVVLYRNVVGG